MTPAQAQYKMRQPRRCKIVGASGEKLDWESWYYVEGGGLDIMVRKPGGAGTVAVKITTRQLEQALALIRAAGSAPASRSGG